MPVVESGPLTELSRNILAAVGAPQDIAEKVAKMLVKANLCGVDSHGVMRIPEYVRLVREGVVKPSARPRVLKRKGATAVVDGRNAFGQVSGLMAMGLAIDLARRFGTGTVTALRTNHMGRIADYTAMAARNGMVGIAFVKSGPFVAPWGGRERLLGTSPLSFAVPAGSEAPIMVDFATSVSSEGRIRVRKWKKRRLPAGWVTDRDGNPSRDPEDLYRGGAIRTFGTYKGYGLNLVAEALGGALTGQGIADDFRSVNGAFMQAIDVQHFVPRVRFEETVDRLILKVHSSKPAKSFRQVLVPGDPEEAESQKRLRNGIGISQGIWDSILEVARETNVSVPKAGRGRRE